MKNTLAAQSLGITVAVACLGMPTWAESETYNNGLTG